MAQRQKRFYALTTKRRSFLFDGWLLDLERRCFGWIFTSNRVETTYSSKGTRYSNYHCYFRVSPYTYNILFNLTEVISTIIYFIRSIVRYLLIPIIVIGLLCVIVGAISSGSDSSDMVSSGLWVIGGGLLFYVFGLVLPTLIVSGFGALWRKVFNIDEVLRERLKANGYDPDFEDWGNDYNEDVPGDIPIHIE